MSVVVIIDIHILSYNHIQYIYIQTIMLITIIILVCNFYFQALQSEQQGAWILNDVMLTI